jgi:SAM-dependent methyltransferase
MSLYSEIITPERYNQIISLEHLYIAQADRAIANFIKEKSNGQEVPQQVVELGCGPGRILPLMSELNNIILTAVDHDELFLSHAKNLAASFTTPVRLVLNSVADYRHSNAVNIFYSQGVHHHIPKGAILKKYLNNIYEQLIPGGYYIISDEMLPEYRDEIERCYRLVVWYCHIIAHAILHHFEYLASEEAKTLLDDLSEGGLNVGVKTQEQLQLILDMAVEIDTCDNLTKRQQLCDLLLTELVKLRQYKLSGDSTMDKSRRDYKICQQALYDEIERHGFEVEAQTLIGPIEDKGGMGIYAIRKTNR